MNQTIHGQGGAETADFDTSIDTEPGISRRGALERITQFTLGAGALLSPVALSGLTACQQTTGKNLGRYNLVSARTEDNLLDGIVSETEIRRAVSRAYGADAFGQVIRHGEANQHGVPVELPSDALPIVSDFKSNLTISGKDRTYEMGGTHSGLDIYGAHGTPVLAAHDGMPFVHQNRFGGKSVMVVYSDSQYSINRHTDRFYYLTFYDHLDKVFSQPSRPVKRGDVIGTMGSTGQFGVSPHLHLTLSRGKSYVSDKEDREAINPHLHTAGGEDGVWAAYRPGEKYDAVQQDGRIGLTYPVPGMKDMDYFVGELGKIRDRQRSEKVAIAKPRS